MLYDRLRGVHNKQVEILDAEAVVNIPIMGFEALIESANPLERRPLRRHAYATYRAQILGAQWSENITGKRMVHPCRQRHDLTINIDETGLLNRSIDVADHGAYYTHILPQAVPQQRQNIVTASEYGIIVKQQ